jgi:hypothetical protein
MKPSSGDIYQPQTVVPKGKDMGVINRARVGSSSWAVKAISLLVLVVCSIVCGCKGSQTIWSGEARSPDGKMIATARAFANGGFGVSGAPATFVYLNWTTGSQKPMEILSLNDESDAPDDAAVEMKWLTPTHLELTYKGSRQSIDFQAIKFAGTDISLRNLSGGATSASQ